MKFESFWEAWELFLSKIVIESEFEFELHLHALHLIVRLQFKFTRTIFERFFLQKNLEKKQF